jgi:hypothetical protein
MSTARSPKTPEFSPWNQLDGDGEQARYGSLGGVQFNALPLDPRQYTQCQMRVALGLDIGLSAGETSPMFFDRVFR